jgi:uncharacterized protein YlaI
MAKHIAKCETCKKRVEDKTTPRCDEGQKLFDALPKSPLNKED